MILRTSQEVNKGDAQDRHHHLTNEKNRALKGGMTCQRKHDYQDDKED